MSICTGPTQDRASQQPGVDGGVLLGPSPPWGTIGYSWMLGGRGIIVMSSATSECTTTVDSSTPLLTWTVLLKVSGSQNKRQMWVRNWQGEGEV